MDDVDDIKDMDLVGDAIRASLLLGKYAWPRSLFANDMLIRIDMPDIGDLVVWDTDTPLTSEQ